MIELRELENDMTFLMLLEHFLKCRGLHVGRAPRNRLKHTCTERVHYHVAIRTLNVRRMFKEQGSTPIHICTYTQNKTL